ncbi:hypothetical protein GIB67_013964 [Kingdonia uniflora]|uniref:Cytochrome P450 n=1 Tax=Kingdonia uniflora TaxID=39325 RepID=A0A7J7LDB6_9MAGN|nr:hypothetical protein GIB67_013964 [Kingdonia uniflora]
MVEWPIVGVVPSFIRNTHRVHDWTTEFFQTFGGTKTVNQVTYGGSKTLFTCDPRNIEYITKTNFPNFPKGQAYTDMFDILGEGIFNVDFELWHTQRRAARALLTTKEFRNFTSDMTHKVVKNSLLPFLSHIAKKASVVDLEDVMLRFTFDASFLVVFGSTPNYLSPSFPVNEVSNALDDGAEAILYRHIVSPLWWKLCRYLMIGRERKLAEAWKIIDQNMMLNIMLKKDEILKGVKSSDLVHTYLNAQEGEKYGLLTNDDKFLRDTSLSFLFAGRDTTGTSLAWFFWLIASNPSVEIKILEELKHAVSRSTKKVPGVQWLFDRDDLQGLVYLHAALCESLRLYPTIPLNRKGVLKECKLPDGSTVKPGMLIILSYYASARMDWVWGKDCSEFKPERWIDENGELRHEPLSKFFAFNMGPRTCLGKDIALTQIKSVIASVLFNFHVEVVEGHTVEPKSSLVLHMKNGLKVRIKERVALYKGPISQLPPSMVLHSLMASLQYYLQNSYEIFLAIFCFLSISWYLKNKNPVMTHWPIIDMLPSLLRNGHRIHDWTVDIANTFGCTKFNRGPVFARVEILLTCDPRNAEYMERTNYTNFPKGPDYIKTFDLLGDGLFNVDSELWQIQRRMAHMMFASTKFQRVVVDVGRSVVENSLVPLLSEVARKSSVVDLEDIFLRYTFDTTFATIFGRDPKHLDISHPPNEFAKAMDDALEAIFFRHVTPRLWWKFSGWLMIGEERKLKIAWRTIDAHIDEYISWKREDMLRGVEGTDLLSTYMALQEEREDQGNERNDLLSRGDKFLRDTVLTLFFAGRDTTGSALSWFFWLIAKNPRVEQKLHEELNIVFSKNKSKGATTPWVFDPEDLKRLVYLDAALCEALRLYPPLPLNRKGVIKEDVLPDGRVVKPGMMIVISMYAMARMEWLWGKDCLEFKPERWIGENGRLSNEPKYNFFTFSQGPRTCLGRDMAFTLMRSAAAAMIFNFHVEVVKDQNVCPKPSIVLQMKNGLLVKIKERIHINVLRTTVD